MLDTRSISIRPEPLRLQRKQALVSRIALKGSSNCFTFRAKSEFFTKGIDERVAQISYEHHCTKVHETIKEVFRLRRDLGIYI